MGCETQVKILKELRDNGATVEQLKAARTVIEEVRKTPSVLDRYKDDKYKTEVDTRETTDQYDARMNRLANNLIGKTVTIENSKNEFMQSTISQVSYNNNKLKFWVAASKDGFKDSYTQDMVTNKLIDAGYSVDKPLRLVETHQFTEKVGHMNRVANQYVANMAEAVYVDSTKILAPIIQEFHEKMMKEDGLYKTVYNTIKDGLSDIELVQKIRDTLFLEGDTSREKIAKLTKEVDKVSRWAMETLTNEMPHWDKLLLDAIPDKNEQRLLTEVYGLSGFGALYQYKVNGKSIVEMLENGILPEKIIGEMNTFDESKSRAKRLMNRLVHQKVQDDQVVNAAYDRQVAAMTVLYTLAENNNAGYKLMIKMKEQHPKLHTKLKELAITSYTLNDLVNKGVDGMSVGNASNQVYQDYEGHGLLDLYSNSHEVKVVTEYEYNSPKYHGKLNPWKTLRKPNGSKVGIVFRKSQNALEKGLGVNADRISNGLHIDTQLVQKELEKDKNWLLKNNVQEYTNMDGGVYYRMILTTQEATEAEGMNNVMQSLYRSIVHNTELTKSYGLQNMILSEFTEYAGGYNTEALLQLLEDRLAYNETAKKEDRQEIKPFLETGMSYTDLQAKYPRVAKKYKIAKNVTTYGGLNNRIKYVRAGMSDMMLGFQQGSIVNDNWPVLQDAERRYKQLVVLKKLKMVVASPTKLLGDIASNSNILLALDVSPVEGAKNMKESVMLFDETSTIEAELVTLEMEISNAEAIGDKQRADIAKAKYKALDEKFKKHIFYDAYKYGFVQSLATGMMIKEFDTISGLQHTIDEVVNKITKNENGSPNILHDYIVKWMKWGYSVEDVLGIVARQVEKKNKRIADEIMDMANRLKAHKLEGKENVPAYVSEVIAGPESELVRQGSRVMQMSDVMARWALYRHLLKEELSDKVGKEATDEDIEDLLKGKRFGFDEKVITAMKDKAGVRALDTFVDYRLNLPSELKAASDLGVLWFPAYWLRNAVIIPQLVAAKPLNSMIAEAISVYTGIPTVYENHPIFKAANGTLVHAGMDVATVSTFIPYVK